MVHQKLKLCKTDINPVLDLAWYLLRLQPQGVVPIPNGAYITPNQKIPLWYGLYHNLSRELHTRQLLMQNQSRWPPCTQRCENVRTCQQHSASTILFQKIDQQLYAFAQQLKWAFPDELPEVEIWPVTYIPSLGFTTDLTDPSSECLERARK